MEPTDVSSRANTPDDATAADGVVTRRVAGEAAIGVGQNVLPVRNRVQWGPIAAGAVFGLVALLVLTVLGLAIGASAFEPDTDLGDWDTWAGVWGGLSVLAAFLAGGWIAGKTAAVEGSFAALMNGLLAGAAMLLALIVLTATGLTNLVGFLGGNLADIADYAADVAQGEATTPEARAAFDDVRDAAWGTLVTLVVALAAAALGGVLGRHERLDLIEGTG